jgi:hypothetical protein
LHEYLLIHIKSFAVQHAAMNPSASIANTAPPVIPM